MYLGTPDVSLQPTLTCNPKSGLGKRQFINGNCFGTPNLLQNGPYQYPYLRGPAYFDSDLSAQKRASISRRGRAFSSKSRPSTSSTTHSQPSPQTSANEYTLNLTNPSGANYHQRTNNPSVGIGSAAYSTGRRVVELMAK